MEPLDEGLGGVAELGQGELMCGRIFDQLRATVAARVRPGPSAYISKRGFTQIKCRGVAVISLVPLAPARAAASRNSWNSIVHWSNYHAAVDSVI